MINFDDFDWEDATTFGGIVGFVQESLKEADRRDSSEPSEDDEPGDYNDEEEVISTKRQLQMLDAQDPDLARSIITKAKEQSEQWALQAQARQLISAADKADKLQEEENQKGALSSETMSDALAKWAEYKWADLSEEEHEEYPVLYMLAEVITDELKVTLDYLKTDGKWEEKLVVQPRRFAKLKNRVYLHGTCDQWKKDWYFRMDRVRNIRLAKSDGAF